MTDIEFIKIWNGSVSVKEVVSLTGKSYWAVTQKASRLRKEGHTLKNQTHRFTKEHYRKIGAIGGKNGHTGGFFADRELARRAGKLGGRISRRGKSV